MCRCLVWPTLAAVPCVWCPRTALQRRAPCPQDLPLIVVPPHLPYVMDAQAGRRTVTGSKFRFFVSRLVSTLQSESQVRFVYTLRTNEDHHPRFVEPAVLERQINGGSRVTMRAPPPHTHTLAPRLSVCTCVRRPMGGRG